MVQQHCRGSSWWQWGRGLLILFCQVRADQVWAQLWDCWCKAEA
jgi:hypothetical protein